MLSLEGNEFFKQLRNRNVDLLDVDENSVSSFSPLSFENSKRTSISDVNQFQTTIEIAEKYKKKRMIL